MKKRIMYVDYLKIFAIFGVVMSHSLTQILQENVHSFKWNVGNIILQTVSPAVGIFFMVSGALILSSERTNSIGYLFKHRLVKVGVPFLIWSAATIAFSYRVDGHITFMIWLKKLLLIYNQFPSPAFWFMYPLIFFYLISPLVKVFVDHASNKVIDYIIWLWLITNLLLPDIAAMLPQQIALYFTNIPNSNLVLMGQTFGYFLLGYRLHKLPIVKNDWSKHFIFSLILLVLIVIINYFNTVYQLNIQIIGYTSLLTLLMTMEVYLTVKNWSHFHELPDKVNHSATTVAGLCFGIYLSHGIVMQAVEQYLHIGSFWLVFLLTSVICIVLTYIISKIPKVGYYVIGVEN
ncbi:acyltransferase [Companilactobacillus mishanensis]|uniref:acyltransferase n=1 Tax=Companilactobacillus mishanensis TaxID=2486008 RepID=UPI000F7A568E|nr:acyltransferase [Companilactobacillus mishanensis]